jgi:hypothetical protein
MPDPNLLLAILRFVLTLICFWLPGYLLANRLLRENDYHGSFRVALGFAFSLAVFALIGWPFLWFRWSFASFLSLVEIAWLAFLALAGFLPFQPGKRTQDQLRMAPIGGESRPATPWIAVTALGGYAVVGLGLICLPFAAREWDWAWSETGWFLYGTLFAATLIAGGLAVGWWHQTLRSTVAFSARDEQEAPRFELVLALVFILAQALSAMAFDRPDWDDCYYLAAVLDYQHAESLNAAEPTHREGLPVSPINVMLVWELWGAMLCHFSGLNPMVVFHTLLPGVLVLLAYAAYGQLLAEMIPRRWVPLALLGLAAYHAWGISSHDTPANFLLTRITQGKAVLLHLGLPVLVITLLRFYDAPTWRRWLALVGAALFGLAASTSAIFLEVMLIGCLTLAAGLTRRSESWRWSWIGALAATLPAIFLGALIRQAVLSDPAITPRTPMNWDWRTWFAWAGHYCAAGTWEAIWLLSLPLLWLLLGSARRRTYLLVFPLVLLATFHNPLLADPVAYYLTSYPTFFRVFWLYPVAIGLGVLLALLARLLSQGSRVAALPATIAISILLGSWAMPSHYVWGPNNLGIITRPAWHPVGDNLMKMPRDLVIIADRMLAHPQIDSVRILAPEAATSYLTPYSRDFRFVQTRTLYTLYMLDQAQRSEEGEQRYLLMLLLGGWIPQQPGERPLQVQHPYYDYPRFPDPPRLLDRQWVERTLETVQVRYAIVRTEPGAQVKSQLELVGFKPVWSGDQWTLWERSNP